MVIAIDGPAGSGKSTVARQVAERLGFIYIDTGAMYRAIALVAIRKGVALDDRPALEDLARSADLRFVPESNRLLLGDEDITSSIRTAEVSQSSSIVSTVEGVRRELVSMQRRMGRDGNVVMEGRDIGSVVFPNAEVKVYLDASPEARARRRFEEEPDGMSFEQVVEEIRKRDERDRQREHSPLVRAPGAVEIDTTTMTIPEVVDRVAQMAATALTVRSGNK